MPSLFEYRLLVVVPEALAGTLNTRLPTLLGPEWANTFTVRLSPSGSPPATHRWACWANVDNDFLTFLREVCDRATIPRPTGWSTKTRVQKRQWVLDQRQTIRTKLGVWLMPMANDGPWDDPRDALTFLNLKPMGAALVNP